MENELQSRPPSPLATEPIGKLLTKFAVPSIIGMIVTSLYNIVDQIFIGQYEGLYGNAATNVAFPISTICLSMALLLGIGGAANFNLSMGAKKPERAGQFVGTSITMLVTCGVIFMIIVRLFLPQLLWLFGATGEVMPLAMTYAGITSFGIPFLVLSPGLSHLIRADGSPTYSMTCMMIGAGVNTILDPILIFKFDMGIAGAAWATVISQIISFLVAFRYLFKFKTIKLEKRFFRLKFEYLKAVVSLGMASCFNQLAMMTTQVVMNNVLTYYGALSPYGSEIPLGCVGVITKVNVVLVSFVVGTSQGSQPIIGFNYGAKNYKRVKETFKKVLITVTIISTVGFLCFQLFPRQIISIFGEGDEMYFHFAERYFRIFLAATFINGLQPATATFFTSIGKAKRGILLSLTRQVLFLIPLILILPYFMGIDGVMYAGPIADVAAMAVAGVLIYKEMRNMNKEEKSPLIN